MNKTRVIVGIVIGAFAVLLLAGTVFGWLLPTLRLQSLCRTLSIPLSEAVPADVHVSLDGRPDTLTEAYMLVDTEGENDEWPFYESLGFGHRLGWNFPEGTREIEVLPYNARQDEALYDYPAVRMWLLPYDVYDLLMMADNPQLGDQIVYGDEKVEAFGLSGYARGATKTFQSSDSSDICHYVLALPDRKGCVYADMRKSSIGELSERLSIELS